MSHQTPSAHHPQGRRAGTRIPLRRQRRLWRASLFAVLTVSLLGTAVWLIWSPLASRRVSGQAGNVVALNADMAGFSMSRIEAKVGQPLTIKLRSLDTTYHSDGGGKHQFAIDALAVSIIAPAKGTAEATFTPTQPGTYQFFCDICCGGRANPSMQGELVVTA